MIKFGHTKGPSQRERLKRPEGVMEQRVFYSAVTHTRRGGPALHSKRGIKFARLLDNIERCQTRKEGRAPGLS